MKKKLLLLLLLLLISYVYASSLSGFKNNNVYIKDKVIFEGATADDYETTITVTDPTADRTVTLGNLDLTFDQNVETTAAVTFATVDTGQGAYELQDADDDGSTKGLASFDNTNFDATSGNVTIVNDGHSHTAASITGFLIDAGTVTDNTIPAFDGTDGVTTQPTGVTIDDSDNLTTTAQLQGEHLVSTDDADINDNLTVGDVIIDEAVGTLDFTGATSATITSSGSGAIGFGDENLATSGTLTLSSLTQHSIPFIGSGGVISENNSKFKWTNSDESMNITNTTGAGLTPIFEVTTDQERPSARYTSTHAGASFYVMFTCLGDNAADKAFGMGLSGENYARYQSTVDGVMEWGTGAVVRDTNLYRYTTNTLATDDHFYLTAGDVILNQSDSNEKISSDADGYVDIYATTATRFRDSDGGNINLLFTGALEGNMAWHVTNDYFVFVDDILMYLQEAIYFDSTDTYIKTNTDDPEDMLIGADQDIHMEPDNAVTIGDGGTTNYATFANDGELNLVGTARVYKYAWTSINAVSALGANAATETVNGNGFVVFSFADNVDRYIQYNLKVPDDMDLSADSYLCLGWSSPTISQVAIVDMTYLITAPGDTTEAAGTADTGNQLTSSGTADGLVVSSVVTIAGGTIQSDEVCIHVILMRDGNDANDTLGDVMEAHGVALKYVSNKLGEAT